MLKVIGMGPGNIENCTYAAVKAIKNSKLIIGYKLYIEILKKEFPDLNYEAGVMTEEKDRCRRALQLASADRANDYALISSGDAGVYGMAGVCYEVAEEDGLDSSLIEVIPGVSAANAAASLVGAPLANDFAVLSLSDRLMPLEKIYQRVEAAAAADLVICIYNPRSKKRPDYLNEVRNKLLKERSGDTPVAIVENAYRNGEKLTVSTLAEFDDQAVNMLSIVIIGNSMSKIIDGKLITERGYGFKK